jgi:two-component system, NarL family, nitrate/nitrite response regulator NarL
LWGLERLIEADTRMRVVGTASCCEELMERLPVVQPDVILLDLDLNGTSSLSCLEKLPLLEHKDSRVLIFTGSNDPALHHEAVVRGARGVVHKQVSADVLLRAIEKVHEGEIWLDRTTLGRVMATLSNPAKKPTQTNKLETLTTKERQIVTALVEEKGARNKLIADKLHMSEHTLRNHLTTIYDKLGVEGRMELYLFASSHLQATTV